MSNVRARVRSLCSSLALVLCFAASPLHAQDDPFAASAAPLRTYGNAPAATVRIIAIDSVSEERDAGARRFEVTTRLSQGVLVDRGLIVTSTSGIGAATVVLVRLPSEVAPRLAYVVGSDAARGLVALAVPSARTQQVRLLERRASVLATAELEAFVFANEGALSPSIVSVSLRDAHRSGRLRVERASEPGALVVGADDTLRGLVHVEEDGDTTLVPMQDVHAFHDASRARADALRAAPPEAEALVIECALALHRAKMTLDDVALAAALEPVRAHLRDDSAARVSLELLPVEASVVIVAALLDAAALDRPGAQQTADAARLRSRRIAAAALARDASLRARRPFLATLSAEAAIADTASPSVPERGASPASGTGDAAERDDTRPSFHFTGAHAPRFFTLALSAPFAPDGDVRLGGFVFDTAMLWMLPKGNHEASTRGGVVLGPAISVGANGGDALARVGVEIGAIARFGRKPGLFLEGAWIPGMYFAERDNAFAPGAFRGRVGVSIGRFSVALGYDVATGRGLYAYHAIGVALVRER